MKNVICIPFAWDEVMKSGVNMRGGILLILKMYV